METVALHGPRLGVGRLCRALAVPRATYYRHLEAKAPPPRPTPARALTVGERRAVLDVLHEPRFADQAPAEIYARLLDENRYLCSERTMYRILAANAEVRERRDQLRHPTYKKPELLATAPNQVWSWDITKLLGPAKWTYFYLYVLLDIFSRYVVGWMIAHRESATLAKKLIEESCQRHGITPGQLAIHADRGPSMTSKTIAHLYADLGVTQSHSRPNVSNDNPFSEAQFKTLKYRPDFP
jgi:putative transposase